LFSRAGATSRVRIDYALRNQSVPMLDDGAQRAVQALDVAHVHSLLRQLMMA
jgi:hypothetical protein